MTTETETEDSQELSPELEAAIKHLYDRPVDERETVIVQCASDDTWIITTDDPTRTRKLLKRYSDYRIDGGSFIFTVPDHAISFRKEEKQVRQMTEEQRTAARDRLMNARKAKKTA